jgi:hypothetical protein
MHVAATGEVKDEMQQMKNSNRKNGLSRRPGGHHPTAPGIKSMKHMVILEQLPMES